MKASIRLIEAIKKLNDKIDNIKIKEPKDGKDGKNGLDGKDGIGIKKIEIKDDNLIITLTDNKKYNLGKVVGKDGEAGKSGRNGRDATINGENTLTIEAGDNITISQDDDVLTISSTASGLKIVVVQELPEIGSTDTFYLVPKTTSQTNNLYDEYIYNNGWELIGTTEIDLTDYVKNTDYANSNKGGVFKTSSNFATTVTSGGYLVNGTKTYNDYQSASENMFVSKGTLDNVIAGKNLVSDANYVHTDNNFDDDYMTKLDYIVTEGSGESFLADDGSYYPISSDIRIPNITIKCIVKDGEKYLRLVFGAYSKAFEDYVIDNGISIHLLRYKSCYHREWNEVIKSKEKKWIHPANDVIVDRPDKQCWGFACYQIFMGQQDYRDQLENAEYEIANNGMVQSEYSLTYSNFKKGYLDINVRDLMSCIVKKGGPITPEDTDMKIPTYGDGELVKIMGTRTSPRRKRVRQPIKYVFALPIITSSGRIKYQYGNSNEAVLELMTLRDQQAMKGYPGGNKLLDDIGFGVLIK